MFQLHTSQRAHFHPGCVFLLLAIGTSSLGSAVCLLAVLHVVVTCTVGALLSFLTSSGHIAISLAVEVLCKSCSFVEHLTGVNVEILQ